MDLKVQNIQIDNCLPGHTWPIVFAKVPPKQTVAALDMSENDVMMLYIQITWGSSAEHNITKYRNFHVLLQECFLNLDIDFLREVYYIFSSTSSNSVESETYRIVFEIARPSSVQYVCRCDFNTVKLRAIRPYSDNSS